MPLEDNDFHIWKRSKTTNKSSTNLSLVSVSRKLLNENKINQEFLDRLTFITYEELIALKLEQTAKIMGTPYLGFSLWNTFRDICRDALVKYAYSVGLTAAEASMIIGISRKHFHKITRRYHPKYYFKDYIISKNKNVLTTEENDIMERVYK